jgi:hypothetical protein
VSELLARFRVALGFAAGAVVYAMAEPTVASLAAGTMIAASGEALRFWAAGHLNKSAEVTDSGPYRWFAHPLYVGSSLIGVGLAVAAASVPVAILIAAYLAATIGAAVKTEEAFLRRRFGEAYDRYRAGRTPRDRALAPARRFSAARALANREHRTIAGLVVAVLLLLLKATYNDFFWRAAG